MGQLSTADALGKPNYTGDDGAIIYSAPNPAANTLYSLVRQPIGVDGITATGATSLWLSDADFAAIYRRGTFIASNAVPTVTLTSPGAGQVFDAGSDIVLEATASDPDGQVAKVEFYQGSTKLGESTSVPHSFTWSKVPGGIYHILARAIDNLGASSDSSQVTIVVGAAPQLSGGLVVSGHFQFTIVSGAGSVFQVERSTDLKTWTPLGPVTNVNGSVVFRDPNVLGMAAGFYRLRQ